MRTTYRNVYRGVGTKILVWLKPEARVEGKHLVLAYLRSEKKKNDPCGVIENTYLTVCFYFLFGNLEFISAHTLIDRRALSSAEVPTFDDTSLSSIEQLTTAIPMMHIQEEKASEGRHQVLFASFHYTLIPLYTIYTKVYMDPA